jgi:HAD superfamily hydrolase (TIGR01459 family)
MQHITGLSTVINGYDALLLDLWGVIHDGSELYPGVHDALVQLRGAGKKIIFLSNAPRRASKVKTALTGLGIEPALYDGVVSSGEAGYHYLAQNRLGHYYYMGPDKDADVLDGLDYLRVDDLKAASFILNFGFGSEEQSTGDMTPVLRAARLLALPMLCLNPDLEVVKITGQRFPCAGVLAHAYQDMGGEVVWFGKPYAEVYDYSMQLLTSPSPLEGEGRGGGVSSMDALLKIPPHPNPPPQGGRGYAGKPRILAIGDSLETDIPGALHYGIDCALVTGGILKEKTVSEIEGLCRELRLEPTYIMPRLAW